MIQERLYHGENKEEKINKLIHKILQEVCDT